MFAPINDLPPGVIGFVARGRIGAADRDGVLEPTVEWAVEQGRVRLLYVIGSDFGGYDRGGLYDDVVFGTRHFTDFDRIAFVADDGPFSRAVEAMSGLMPAALRVFALPEVEAAKSWLSEPEAEAASPATADDQPRGLSGWLTQHVRVG